MLAEGFILEYDKNMRIWDVAPVAKLIHEGEGIWA
jgi:hypothetical protein